LKFTLSQIRKSAFQEPFIFEREVDVSELENSNNDIRQIKPVKVNGICTIDKDEIIFALTIKGEMILPCARTLVDVPYKFQIEATEVFTTSQHYTPEDEENEVHQLTDEVIDLAPYIKENIVLNIPFRVFSNEEMIDEGEGWSYYTEDDQQETNDQQIDPRLKKLQLLLNDREGKDKED